MEVDNETTTMQCFKIPCNILGNLKISYDVTSSTIVLWTKFLLLVYKSLHFKNYSKKIEPPFEIDNVIVLKDCLLCLDCSGNVNIDTFESFIIWKQNINCICACEIMNICYVLSLQFKENKPVLLVNEFNMNESSNESNELKLEMPDEDLMIPGKNSILVCSHIQSGYSKRLKNIFNVRESDSNYLLVVVSLDKRNVHAVLITKDNIQGGFMNSPNPWVKLYKSHIDIVDIKISMVEDIYMLVGLAGGNIVRISLLLKNHKPEVYHLNTTINKFTSNNNTIIYSDVLTMWKNQNAFSKSDSQFEQFIVRNVRDFCLIKNQIVCVTFANLIYSFDISHRSSYINPHNTDYTCPIQLVTNSACLQEIIETVNKNEYLLKKINNESEYLMALSLSKRQDIMDNVIKVTGSVCNNYRELVMKNTDLTLTDELDAYYDSDSYYFLINIIVNRIQHKLNKLLSDVLGDIKIHITLSTHGVLKTTSIQIKGQLTTTNFVIPLNRKNKNIKRMQVHVMIITSIPGKYDENQRLWTTLYQKCIDLNAENFIKVKHSKTNIQLKEDDRPLEMLICKRAKHLHGTEYKFHILDCQRYEWTFFIKLPSNCTLMEDILQLIEPLNSKAFVTLKNLLKGSKRKTCLEFQIDNEQVKLVIEGGNLKVMCPDILIASDIRNFFSGIVFTNFIDKLGNELIDHKYYTTIENLKRDINVCVNKRISTEEFATLLTRFLRNVYCLIPI